MADDSSTWTVVVSLFVLVCVVGNLAGWGLLLRWLAGRERLIAERLDDLSRRLGAWERQGREVPRTVAPTGRESASPAPNARSRSAGMAGLPPMTRHDSGSDPNHPTLISIPDLGHGGPTDRQSGVDLSQKHQAVWTLAVSGVSPEEIARQTGQPIGEVELIIGLQRSLQPTQGVSPHVRSE